MRLATRCAMRSAADGTGWCVKASGAALAASLAVGMAGLSPLSALEAGPVTPTRVGGWVAQQAPGYYRLRLGDYRITVLSDGTAPRDLPQIMSNPDAVRRAFAAAHQALPVELSINSYLVD